MDLVIYLFYGAIYRIPVCMNIKEAHEDGYHNSLVMEIRVFFDFFDDNNPTICWSNYNIFCVTFKSANWTTEEIGGYSINDKRNQKEEIKWNFIVKKEP